MLEYCSPVWSPCCIGSINKLESVQRSFTKRLTGMCTLSHESRLKALGLELLELRRLRMDLVTCYNIVKPTVASVYRSVHFLSLGLVRTVTLAVIRLNYFILILV